MLKKLMKRPLNKVLHIKVTWKTSLKSTIFLMKWKW